MPVASMTGFARGTGQHGPLTWTWEAKSVNARGLDVRCRVPPGMEALDPLVRRAVGNRFKRGNFSILLQVDSSAQPARLQVNREALAQLEPVVRELCETWGATPPSADGLLNIRGVVEWIDDETSAQDSEDREQALLAGLDVTLDDLGRTRAEEGRRIGAVLDQQLDEIVDLVEAASGNAETRPDVLRARLDSRLAEFAGAVPALSEERLAQEVAVLLVKGDIREEIDRLRAHIAAARELLERGGPAGRRLDFLCQEFNREGNTLCAKASDVELTRIGLDLKTVIDQLREQVQNIE